VFAVEEGSKDIKEGHIAPTPSVHQFNATGSLGSPLSVEPFQNSGDWRCGAADTRLSLSSPFWDDLVCLRAGIAGALLSSSLVPTIVG
jgi:hypothetical protein